MATDADQIFESTESRIAFDAAERFKRERDEARSELEVVRALGGARDTELADRDKTIASLRSEVSVLKAEIDTRVKVNEQKSYDLVAVVRRVLDDPQSSRAQVQGLLLNAIQRYDG